jgi:hypothetical protein
MTDASGLVHVFAALSAVVSCSADVRLWSRSFGSLGSIDRSAWHPLQNAGVGFSELLRA